MANSNQNPKRFELRNPDKNNRLAIGIVLAVLVFSGFVIAYYLMTTPTPTPADSIIANTPTPPANNTNRPVTNPTENTNTAPDRVGDTAANNQTMIGVQSNPNNPNNAPPAKNESKRLPKNKDVTNWPRE